MEGLLLFLIAVAWILGTLWVFADAVINSSKSAVLWGLVAFFGGVLGLLLYVLLGRDATDDAHAPERSDLPPEYR